MAAIDDLKRAGAVIVDPARVELGEVRRPQGGGQCGGFKYDINRYLAAQGDRVPVHTLEEIIRSRRFHPSIEARLQSAQSGSENGPDTPACKAEADYREAFRGAVAKTMDDRQTGRVRLSDVEQPAAPDRRSQHPARRQQPGVLADDRVAGDQRADGLHARDAAGGRDVLRAGVERGDADQAGLRLRAGDAPSPSTGEHATAALVIPEACSFRLQAEYPRTFRLKAETTGPGV